MRLKTNLAADGAILLTTLIWGSTFAVARGVLDQWPPLTYLAVRMPLAALLFAALFPRQVFKAPAAAWRAGATLGVLMGLGFIGQTVGLVYTTPAKSAFITGITTPLVPVVAYVVWRARPSRENLLGIVLASIGGALILAPANASGVNAGDLFTLSTTLLFAAHITLMSLYARRFDARRLSALQVTTAAALVLAAWLALRVFAAVAGEGALPPGLAREVGPPVWSAAVVWQLVYLSVVATVATFLLWTWGQARMSATHAAVIFSLEPVFATIFAVLLRGSAEWTGGRATLGALLVVTGVLVSELRWGRRRADEAEAEPGEPAGETEEDERRILEG
ncbi:MAG TPA: DMT family transporter [Pyrinomonadaceae bacterium]|jgi:drug/metabolite transporter (DMT)-like permease